MAWYILFSFSYTFFNGTSLFYSLLSSFYNSHGFFFNNCLAPSYKPARLILKPGSIDTTFELALWIWTLDMLSSFYMDNMSNVIMSNARRPVLFLDSYWGLQEMAYLHPLRFLFISLVRPHLEYGSITWNPYQLGHRLLLERIQIRLVQYIGV